jgi:prepilin-type N-terminal cleavage/methylation domain-containing protein
MQRVRRGFSLAELLVAVVLVGIIGGALSKMVVNQMRFFDTVQVMRGARSAARNSMNVMLSDLRMVQDSGGVTAVATGDKSITVNVPYSFGLYCGNTGGVSIVSMLPGDSASLAMAKFAGYAWRKRSTGRYTVVSGATATVTTANTTVCTTSAGINTISITPASTARTGLIYELTPVIPSTTAPGSAVFFYQTVTYSFAASSIYPGQYGLWRSVSGGVTEELMAPFASTARFRYYTTSDDTSRTTAPSLDQLRGVAIVLDANGSRTPAGRTTTTQSHMMTSVFFKNTR